MPVTQAQADALRVIHDTVSLFKAERYHAAPHQFDAIARMCKAMKEILASNDFDEIEPLYFFLAGYLLHARFETAPSESAQVALRLLGIQEKQFEGLVQAIAAVSGEDIR